MTRSLQLLVGVMVMLMLSSGCASVVTGRGPDQQVRINSTPPGAQVYLNGEPVGRTPTHAFINRFQDSHVRIELEGHRPYERYVESGFNWWTLGNIPIVFPVGTVIGLFVDVYNDSHRAVRPGRIDVRLVPDRPPAEAPAAVGRVDGSARVLTPRE